MFFRKFSSPKKRYMYECAFAHTSPRTILATSASRLSSPPSSLSPPLPLLPPSRRHQYHHQRPRRIHDFIDHLCRYTFIFVTYITGIASSFIASAIHASTMIIQLSSTLPLHRHREHYQNTRRHRHHHQATHHHTNPLSTSITTTTVFLHHWYLQYIYDIVSSITFTPSIATLITVTSFIDTNIMAPLTPSPIQPLPRRN